MAKNYEDLSSHGAGKIFVIAVQYTIMEARSMHFEKQDQCKNIKGAEPLKMKKNSIKGAPSPEPP